MPGFSTSFCKSLNCANFINFPSENDKLEGKNTLLQFRSISMNFKQRAPFGHKYYLSIYGVSQSNFHHSKHFKLNNLVGGLDIMARFKNGWVKLYRKAALGDINSNYTRGGLFGALIAMANIQSSTVDWRGKPRKLKRGEIATSLQELAELGEVDTKTVSKHLAYLELRDTIKVEKSTFGTLISINNYEEYQGQDAEGSTRHPHGMEDAMEEGVQHIEELKKERNKEECSKFDIAFAKFPVRIKGAKAKQRFKDQIKTQQNFDDLIKALDNYNQNLKENPWKAPKQSFETFLGTKQSGFFWEQFIDYTPSQKNNSTDLGEDPRV